MRRLEGVAVIIKTRHLSYANALSDFRRSVWLKAEAAAEVVQYCKNCLLVDLHRLFPPMFACDQRDFG